MEPTLVMIFLIIDENTLESKGVMHLDCITPFDSSVFLKDPVSSSIASSSTVRTGFNNIDVPWA